MSHVTQEQIRSLATPESYARGESYYRDDAIFDTVRRGDGLEGHCQGSDYAPYHVRARVDEDGHITDTSCTCPYDWGGICKHTVALLLTYLRQPELFETRLPVEDSLRERSKEDLVTLIEQMVQRYPDLQALIDRPAPDRVPDGTVVDTAPLRRELQQAVNHYGGWGDHSAEYAVMSVEAVARQFADAEDWRNASLIYRTILDECLNQGEYLVDDEGEYIWALNSVLAELATCLEQDEIAGDDAERGAIIERLLDAYIWDIDMGGYGLGDEVLPGALLQYARQEDLPAIRARVLEAQQRKQQESYGKWGTEAYARFLIQLDALDSTDPEVTLQRLREQGLHRLVFEKLLSMGRVDEAVAVVAEHLAGPYERLQVLPQLVAAGRDDEAVRLARETLRERFDGRLANWLAERYAVRENRDELFELWLQAMKEAPSVEYYAVLQEAAKAIGAWERVRPELLGKLEQDGQRAILVRAYLYDEEWDAAWKTYETIQPPSLGRWVGRDTRLDLEIAQKSRHVRPQKAVPVFVKVAQQEIGQKNRQHYRQAAAYLAIVRDLYRQMDDEESWRGLIDGIRQEHRRLPALQDEIDKAGL